MIKLGGIELNDSLVWTDRTNTSLVTQQRRRSLGGRQIITSAQLFEGRPITLVGGSDFGWLSRTQALAILALADLAGVSQTLEFGDETYTVVFRHDEPPACELSPLVPRTVQEEDDWYVGTIKLITI